VYTSFGLTTGWKLSVPTWYAVQFQWLSAMTPATIVLNAVISAIGAVSFLTAVRVMRHSTKSPMMIAPCGRPLPPCRNRQCFTIGGRRQSGTDQVL